MDRGGLNELSLHLLNKLLFRVAHQWAIYFKEGNQSKRWLCEFKPFTPKSFQTIVTVVMMLLHQLLVKMTILTSLSHALVTKRRKNTTSTPFLKIQRH